MASNEPPIIKSTSRMTSQVSPTSSVQAPTTIPGSVRPLICFPVAPEKYFQGFTIFIIVISSMNILTCSLFSFGPHPLPSILDIFLDIIFLTLASVCYSKFDDTDDYAQTVHIFFSVAILVTSIVVLIGTFLVPVVLAFFGVGGWLSDFLDLKDRAVLITLILLYVFIVIPLASYYVYLAYLYNKVVYWKKEQNEIEEKHKKELALTENDPSNI